MSEPYFCADCNHPTTLDIHGRCSSCNSDAVDSMERLTQIPAVAVQTLADRQREIWWAELERDWRKEHVR